MLRASTDFVEPEALEAHRTPLRERFIVPFLFCLVLLAFNLGLHSLAPSQPVVTRLPFTMTGLNGWTSLSGDWVWDGALRQLNADIPQALIRSPLQLSADNARVHVQMSDGAGVGFLLQDPKSLKGGHVAYVMGDILSVGYVSTLGGFELDFSYKLPAEATVSLQLDTENYAVFINHKLVVNSLPLRHQNGFLTLLAQGEASVSGLLVEAGTAPTDSSPSSLQVGAP